MSPIFPSRKRELIFGLIYLPIHIFLLPVALGRALSAIFSLFELSIANTTVTLIYYIVSFIIVLIIMWGFLRDSFSVLIDKNLAALSVVFTGFFRNLLSMFILSAAYVYIFKQTSANPNTSAVMTQVASRSSHLIFSMLVLAPIVEESLFRGALFDLVRRKNRVAAYIVSYLLFSAYHLWAYALNGIDPLFIFYALQYLPASIILANCYEKTGTIWSPIILHMMINGFSVYMTL